MSTDSPLVRPASAVSDVDSFRPWAGEEEKQMRYTLVISRDAYDLQGAVMNAVAMAKHVGCEISFTSHGVSVAVSPTDTAEEVIQRYQASFASN